MRRVAGALAIGIALILVVAVAGHGGEPELGSGELVWEQQPHIYRNASLPDDRVLRGVVRNDSLRVVTITARDLRVRADDGQELDTAAVFAPTFIRGVFPQNRGDAIPENEQMRIGMRVRLEPGRSAPVTVSWRQGEERPALVDYGNGSLPLPQPLKRRMTG